jgi:SAM-dependent methyltransferase
MTTAAPRHPTAPDTPTWTADAVNYDAWFDEPWGRYAFAVESAAMLRAAGAVTGVRALDAGCGTGRFSAAVRDAGTTLVGIDAAPDMLTLASIRLGGRCARAVIERLPFPDQTFDLTVGVTVLEFVADPDAALAELGRVTRHGGRIVIGALNPHSPWGLANRRPLRAGVWCHARFLEPNALRALGARHGRAALHAALYAPGAFPGLPMFGQVLETLGRAVPRWGAFQVLTIDKDPQP